MSKIVHPYAHRLVTLRDWKSRWFADPKKYVEYLRGDVLLLEYLEKKLRGLYVSSIEIERSRKATRLIIKTSRPVDVSLVKKAWEFADLAHTGQKRLSGEPFITHPRGGVLGKDLVN